MRVDIRCYWDQIGRDYVLTWKKGGRQHISSIERAFIKQALKFYKKNQNNLKVLDLGCGSGRIISVLKNNKKIDSIFGVDHSKPMLDYCQEKFKNSKKVQRFVLADISKKLPFKKNSFDFITAIRVLKYSQNWQEILKGCLRILDKNGILVFSMPNQNSVTRFSSCEVPLHKATEKGLKEFLKESGFDLLTIKGGAVLPGFIYDYLKNKYLLLPVLKIEKLLKKIFGPVFLSRHFYIACKKSD